MTSTGLRATRPRMGLDIETCAIGGCGHEAEVGGLS